MTDPASAFIDSLLDNLPGAGMGTDGSAAAMPVVSTGPDLGDEAFQELNLTAIARDFARQIWPPAVIARNHGLSEPQALLLLGQPFFGRMLKMERAAWMASDNAGEQAKQYHRVAQAMAASELAGMMLDKSLPASLRLDVAKFSARVAGIDVPPKEGPQLAAVGTQFAVNFHFGSGKTESIQAVVGSAVPVIDAVAE